MKKLSVATAAILLAAVATGVGYAGYEIGVRKGVQQAFYCGAIHTQHYVAALGALRRGDADDTIRILETGINGGVLLMASDEDILDERTARAVNETLAGVRRYRKEHPLTQGDAEVNSRVADILNRVEAHN
jgi:hypothetical protein